VLDAQSGHDLSLANRSLPEPITLGARARSLYP